MGAHFICTWVKILRDGRRLTASSSAHPINFSVFDLSHRLSSLVFSHQP